MNDMRTNDPKGAEYRPKHFAESKTEKAKMSKGKKRALIALGIILGLLAIGAGAIGLWLNSLNQTMSLSEEDRAALSDTLVSEKDTEGDAFYILILGSDAREGEGASRSDVTMLARVDPGTYRVALVSIPRDTMVTINGATQKINAAYAFGGAAGAVECVSEFAGVDISHVVEVRFNALEKVVDTLGGVTVNVPESFVTVDGLSFSAGEQTLDGERALAFARERKHVSGGDFGRAQAQRTIMEAIIRQVVSASPTEIPGLISQLATAVTTDYTVTDMAGLALEFVGKDMEIFSAACPSYAYNLNGISYVATEFDEWREMMQRVDAGLDPNDATSPIPEEQQDDERLGAAANSPAPKDYHQLAENSMNTDDVAPTA